MDKTSTSKSSYQYSTIADNEIRVILLQPGRSEDDIECELRVQNINSTLPYEALSYRWGAEQNEKLFCKEGILHVSAELSEALRRYRHESEIKTLWVDQISINQSNDAEKSAQVRRMGSTYSNANQVLVWLGEEDSDIAMVFNLIIEVYTQIAGFTRDTDVIDAFQRDTQSGSGHFPLRLTSADSAEWVAFRKLCGRPWFARTWTFQELVLSRQATITCGSHTVSWKVFLAVCEMVHAFDRACLPGHESHLKETYSSIQYLAATNLFLSRQLSKSVEVAGMNKTTELLNLVKSLRKNSTSKPKDKLLALWGCATDKDSAIEPFVDYSVPFEKTYIVFTKWFINRYGDLSVFRLMDINNKKTSLPSWTPDFRIYDQFNSLREDLGPKVLLHGNERTYLATGSSKVSTRLNYDPTIKLQGVCVGKISILSEAAGNLLGNVGIGPNVLTHGLWHRTVAEHFSDGTYPPTGEPIKLAYHRLRVGDQVWGESQPNARRSRSQPLQSISEPGDVTYSAIRGIVNAERDDVGTLILKWTTRQRLFITDTGYMGLAHRTCQTNDQVFLLMGGEMPFILRKKEAGIFQFKGESYVHGIMDGEYLVKTFKQNDISKGTQSDEEWLASLETLPFETEDVVLE